MTNATLTQPQHVDVQRAKQKWRTYTRSSIYEAFHQWRTLEHRIHSTSLASSATWVECWVKHYGDVVPYKVLSLESDGIVRGMTLITNGVEKKLGPFNINTTHLGTAGEPQIGSVCVEYNRPLVQQEYTADFIQGIWNSLDNDSSWEQLCLDGFSESDLQPWLSHHSNLDIRYRDSRYFDLAQSRGEQKEVIEYLGKSTRANLRRTLRKYEKLDCEWADSLSQAEEIFAELMTLHQARWNAIGEPGAFANERFKNFQEEVMARLFSERKLVLFRVKHQGETVGCLMLLVDQNRLLDYLSGFADFNEKPSPGLISHYLCMQESVKHGFAAYDFLVGDKRHKENLSTHTNQLCWLTLNRPSWKVKAYQALRKVKQSMTAVIGRKHNEERI